MCSDMNPIQEPEAGRQLIALKAPFMLTVKRCSRAKELQQLRTGAPGTAWSNGKPSEGGSGKL